MHHRTQFAACLVFLMLLAGCGSMPNPIAPPNLTGNWQIQSASAPVTGSNVPNAVVLLGALQSTGSKVTGTFRFTNLAQVGCDLGDIISVTGAVDSKNTLTLTSSKLSSGGVVSIHLLTIPALGSNAAGTIQVTGGSCPYVSAAAVGVEIASITGTFAGNLLPGTLANPGTTGGGPATLALTQASTPSSDGSFALTGSLTFSVGTCAVTKQLTGAISGAGLALTNTPISFGPGLPAATTLFATTATNAASLSVAHLLIVPSPCAPLSQPPMPFTGTLTKQ